MWKPIATYDVAGVPGLFANDETGLVFWGEGIRYKDGMVFWDQDCVYDCTHWMPVPEAPKREVAHEQREKESI